MPKARARKQRDHLGTFEKVEGTGFELTSAQQQEKRISEEAKVTLELKKRHDLMKKRVEKVAKDKQENVTQLKSLFALFTQQRKALEISIQKNKKLEEDNIRLDTRNKTLEEQQRSHSKRVEQLEAEKDMLA